MKTLAVIAPIVAIGLAGMALLPDATQRPIASYAGSFSAITTARVEVITDAARWETVWKEHMGDKIEKTAHGFDVIPRIDFARCMVLAAFAGDRVNGAGFEVPEILERDGHTVVRYDRIGFQTMSMNGPDRGVKTTDYGFAVLSRSTLPIILEENTQGLIGKPPIWTERQRLPAPKRI